jgi:transformation/transcription domain-associated protein
LGFAKETRKRNLVFCVPATVQLHPNLRLEQNSARGINLSDVYDQWCEQTGITREEPMIAVGERLKQTVREWKQAHGRPLEKVEYWAIKERLIEEVATKMVPTDVLTQVCYPSLCLCKRSLTMLHSTSPRR